MYFPFTAYVLSIKKIYRFIDYISCIHYHTQIILKTFEDFFHLQNIMFSQILGIEKRVLLKFSSNISIFTLLKMTFSVKVFLPENI